MVLKKFRFSFQTFVISGSLCLVFLGFFSARVSINNQNNERNNKIDVTDIDNSKAQGQDIAIALSGSLEQSIPPSWTFVQQKNSSTDILYPIEGAVLKQELVLRSLQQGTLARLLVYSAIDALKVENTINQKNLEEIKLGARIVRSIPTKDGKGIASLLVKGSSEIVILWMEQDKAWKTFADIPGELKDLLQSLRVQ